MTTQSFNIPATSSTDALFRQWGLAISDALTALGIPKTSDTGQVNWASVTAPSTSYPGYEIRYFNDSLHSTFPVYIKIEYGSASANTQCTLRISLATSTDGAGGMTPYFGPTTMSQSSTTTATLQSGIASSIDGSGFVLCAYYQQSGVTYNPFLLLERSRNSSGAITNEGVVLVYTTTASSSFRNINTRIIKAGGTYISSVAAPNVFYPRNIDSTITSLSDGTNIYVAPLVNQGMSTLWQSALVLGYARANFATDATFTATNLGTSRTWKATGIRGWGCRAQNVSGNDTYGNPAIIWE